MAHQITYTREAAFGFAVTLAALWLQVQRRGLEISSPSAAGLLLVVGASLLPLAEHTRKLSLRAFMRALLFPWFFSLVPWLATRGSTSAYQLTAMQVVVWCVVVPAIAAVHYVIIAPTRKQVSS